MTQDQIQQMKQWIKNNQDDLAIAGVSVVAMGLGLVSMYYLGKSRGSLTVEILLKPRQESPYVPINPIRVR